MYTFYRNFRICTHISYINSLYENCVHLPENVIDVFAVLLYYYSNIAFVT